MVLGMANYPQGWDAKLKGPTELTNVSAPRDSQLPKEELIFILMRTHSMNRMGFLFCHCEAALAAEAIYFEIASLPSVARNDERIAQERNKQGQAMKNLISILKTGSILVVSTIVLASLWISLSSAFDDNNLPEIDPGNIPDNVLITYDTPDPINATEMTIIAPDKTIMDFSSFDIAKDYSVNIVLPTYDDGTLASFLARDIGGDISDINGNLNCNGLFVLTNINGISVGPDANINAASLILSTRDITNSNFISSNYIFEKQLNRQTDRLLINRGKINIPQGGFGVLIAGAIDNQGVIVCPMGTIALAGGDCVRLDISANRMISIAIDREVADTIYDYYGNSITSQISNTGRIEAGIVIFRAESLPGLFERAINMTGYVKADKVIVNADNSVNIVSSADIDVTVDNPIARIVIDRLDMDISLSDSQKLDNNIVVIEGNGLKVTYMVTIDFTLKTEGAVDTSPAVILYGTTTTIIANRFGNATTPLNIDSGNIHIKRLNGDIEILESTGIGTTIQITGPPEGFGKIIYPKSSSLSLEATRISVSTEAFLDANTLTLIGNLSILSEGSLRAINILIDSGEYGITYILGLLDASDNTIGQKGGDITILGNWVGILGATIDASGYSGGGTILIGGDYKGEGEVRNSNRVSITSNSTIKANALYSGNGGKVIVWSEEITKFYGKISVKGGPESGNGGFIETSSRDYVELYGAVDTSAPNGASGTWLIDPTSVTISNAATTNIDDDLGDPRTFSPTATGTPATLNVTTLNDALTAGTSVIVDTISDLSEAGNITVSIAIAKTGGADCSLTLNATGNITTGAGIGFSSTSGKLDLILIAGGAVDLNGTIALLGGTFSSVGTTFDNTGATINSADGSVTINHSGVVTIGAAIGGINAVGVTSITGSSISLGADITTNNADLTFNSPVTLTSEPRNYNAGTGTIITLSTFNCAARAVTFTSDGISFGGNLTSTGDAITLQPYTDSTTIGIAGGAGAYNLSLTEIGYLTSSGAFTSITIGSATGTGAIDIQAVTFTDPVTIRSPGVGGSITVTGAFVSNSTTTFTAGSGDSGIFTLTAGSGNTISSGAGIITITADSIALNTTANTITTTSAISLLPSTASRPVVIGADGAASDFALSAAEIASLTTDNSILTIGHASGTGSVNIQEITFTRPVTIQSPGVGGNITVTGAFATTSNYAIIFNAGTGDSGSFTLTAGSGNTISAGGGAITIYADSIALNTTADTITTTNTIALLPSTASRPVVIGADGAASDFALSAAEIASLTTDNSILTIGHASGTGSVNIQEITFTRPVTIQSPGVGGNITVTGAFATTSNYAIIFNAGTGDSGSFTLTAGSGNTISAGGGAITIYADSIALNTTPNTITGTSTILLQPSTTARPVVIGADGAATNFALSTDEIASLTDGFTLITIGHSSGTVAVTVNEITFTDSVTIRCSSGGITLGGNFSNTGGGTTFTASSGAFNNSTYAISSAGDITITAPISFTSGTGGTITSTTGGNITITTNSIAIGDNIASSGGNLTLQPSTAATAVGIAGGAEAFNLTTTEISYLVEGFSSITIGSTGGTGLMTINTVSFNDPVNFYNYGTTGKITVTGAVTTAASNSAITFISGTTTNAFTLTAGAGNTISSGNGTITIYADTIVLNTTANTITGTGDIILQPRTAARPIVIGADGTATDFALSTAEIASLTDGFASITIGRADSSGAVTINAVTFTDPVTIRSSGTTTLSGNLLNTGNDITIMTNSIAIGANITSAGGNLTLQPFSTNTTIGIAGGAGTFNLDVTELGYLVDGFNSITIGRTNGTGATIISAVTFNDPITIQSPGGAFTVNGQITGNGNASVTLNGTTTTLNADIVTAGNAILIDDTVSLGSPGTITLDTTNAGGSPLGANITISGTVTDTSSGSSGLTLNAGTTGNISLQAVGTTTYRLSNLTVTSANSFNAGVIYTTGAGNISITNLSDSAITGTITCAGTLTKLGAGTLTLSGSNTITGGLYLNEGILVATVAGAFGTSANTLYFNGGNLELRANTTTFTGKLDTTNTGGTIYINPASLNDGVTHTISGTTNLGSNTIVISAGALTNTDTAYGLILSGASTLSGNPTLTINGNGSATGTLTISGGFNTGGNTRTVTFNSGTGTSAAVISGAFAGTAGILDLAGTTPTITVGSLTTTANAVRVSGTGTYTFSGTSTFTGGVILNNAAATVIVTTAGGFGATSGKVIFNVANTGFTIRGDSAITLTAGLDTSSYGGTITIDRVNAGAGVIHVMSLASTFGGNTVIVSPGANINADSAYGLTLSGAVTLSGDQIFTINGNGTATGTLTISGGFDTGGATRTVTFNNGTGTGAASISGAFAGSAGILDLAGTTPTITVGSLTTTANAVRVSGTGTYTFSGTSTFTGGVILNNAAATVIVTTAGGFGATSGKVIFNVANTGFTIRGDSAITLTAGLDTSSYGGTITIDRVNAGAGVIHVMSLASTFGGNTVIVSPGANINADSAYGLTLSGAATLSGTNTFTVNNNSNGTGTLTIGTGILSSTGSITKNGAGTLTLSGNNSFEGGIVIQAGTVSGITSANAFGTGTITIGDSEGSSDVTLNGGLAGTFTNLISVASDNSGVATITSSAASIFSGAVTLNSHDLILSPAANALTLTGGITGAGNLVLNSTAAGVITLSTTSVNNTGTITNSGAGSATNIISGGVGSNVTAIIENSAASALTISTNAITMNGSGTTLTNSNPSGTKVLTISGGITGAGNLVLNNNSSITSGITISTTSVNNTGTITNSGAGAGDTLISAVIGADVTTVIQNSSTSQLTLTTGTNLFTGGLLIKAGTVSGNVAGSFGGAASTITIGDSSGSANATLNGALSGTFANPISVASGNSGIATITSTANSIFSGAVTLYSHDLSLSPVANSLTLSGGITGTGNLVLNSTAAGAITISTTNADNIGTITNSGAGSATNTISAVIGTNVTGVIQNSGTSALTLSGTNDFTCAVTISGGTLNVSADRNLGAVPGEATPAAITFNGSGATLKVTANFTLDANRGMTLTTDGTIYTNSSCTLTYGGALAGNGGLNKDGTGAFTIVTDVTLVVNGTLTLTDGTINTGIIEAKGDIVQASTSDLGTATIKFTGDGVQTYTMNGGYGPNIELSGADATSNSFFLSDNSGINNLTIKDTFADTMGCTDNGYNFIIIGNFTNEGGTFTAPAKVQFGNNTQATRTFDVATSQTFTDVTIYYYSASYGLNLSGDTMVVNGTLTLTNGTISTGTIEAEGNIVQESTFDGGSATIKFTGDGAQTYTMNGGTGLNMELSGADITPNSLILNENSLIGSLTITDTFEDTMSCTDKGYTLTILGNFTNEGGTFTAPAKVQFGNNTQANRIFDVATSQTFTDVTIYYYSASYSLNLSGDTMVVTGTLTLTNGVVNTGTIEARGNVVVGSGFDGGSASLLFSGSSGSGLTMQTFDLTGATGAFNADITISKTEGQVDLLSGLVMNAANQDLIIEEGTLDLNGNLLTVNGTSGTFVVQDGGNLQLQGVETITANPTYPSFETGSTVTYDGSDTYVSLILGNTYKNLAFNGTGSWTPDGALDVNGNFDLIAGTFIAPATVNISGNLNLYPGSVFDDNDGTITLDGTEAQSVTSNSHSFYDLTVTNTSGSGLGITFMDSCAVTGTFKDNTADSKLTFHAGSTYAFASIDIKGAADHRVIMVSSSADSHWFFNVAQASPAVYYVNVQDSDADGGNNISANNGSFNSGNNHNWTFNAGVLVSGTAFASDEINPLTGTSYNVAARVNGGDPSTTTTNTGNGTWVFSLVPVTENSTVTIYFYGLSDSESGDYVANVVTVSDGISDITNIVLIVDHVSLRADNASTPLTIADMSLYDNDNNPANLLFTAETGTPNTLTLEPGKELFIAATETFTPGGNIIAGTGGIDINGIWTVTGTETINCAGDFDATDGTFTAASGTITFDGTIAQSITPAGESYNNIVVTNNSAAITFEDAFTTVNFTAQTPSTSLKFKEGETFTVSGTLILNGQAEGTRIVINSKDGSTRFTFNITGSLQYVSYLDVSNSQTSSNDIIATYSLDTLNNDTGEAMPRWFITEVGLITVYWVGSVDNLWSTAGNWEGGTPSGHEVQFDSAHSQNTISIADGPYTLRSLTLTDWTGTITITGDLTLSDADGATGKYTQSSADSIFAETIGFDGVTDPYQLIVPVVNATYFSKTAGIFRDYDNTYGGLATVTAPAYRVATIDNLQHVKDDLTRHYAQVNNIESVGDFTAYMIGDASDNAFSATYDGNGYYLADLVIDTSVSKDKQYVGFFGYTDGARLYNINLFDLTFDVANTATMYVGGLAAYSNDTDIINCSSGGSIESNVATVNAANFYTGGLAGYSTGFSAITDSHSAASVDSTFSGVNIDHGTGGLVGCNDSSTITGSYATGIMEAYSIYSSDIGGLVGKNINSSTISNSYYAGTRTAYAEAIETASDSSNIGGLVGNNDGTSAITNCYSIGNIIFGTRASGVGGLVGYNAGSITYCYATGNVTVDEYSSNTDSVGGLVGINDTSGVITDSFSTGKVIANTTVGGFVGDQSGSVPATSYWYDDPESSVHVAFGSGSGNCTKKMDKSYFYDSDNEPLTTWFAQVGNPWEEAIYEDYPYFIYEVNVFTLSDLLAISSGDLRARYRQGANIDLSSVEDFHPYMIGSFAHGHPEYSFRGAFNGNGYTISNLTINESGKHEVGFFGDTDAMALISNVILTDIDITAGWAVGGLVGYNDGTINNCSTTGDLTSVGGSAGGLVGYNYYGIIINSYSEVDVFCDNVYVGGLVGENYGDIDNCYATGSVTTTECYAGGLVGASDWDATITNSYATGNVDGGIWGYAGGLVGSNEDSSLITNCYSTGAVTGSEDCIGGLVGYWDSGEYIVNSHYNVSTAGLDYVSIGALYSDQFDDWLPAKSLDINSYLTNDGTYYLLGSVQNLKDFLGFSDSSALRFKVTANIDLTGNDGFHIPYLCVAEFNGNDKTISNLEVNTPYNDYIGLFGYVGYIEDYTITISDLHVENVNIAGGSCIGGLVGYNYDAAITDCYVTGSVTGTYNTTGGLVGYNWGNITNCHADVTVIGDSNVGGLVGYNKWPITNSYATGNVSGESNVGGLVGNNTGTITDSYATGSVTGDSQIGGLVGSVNMAGPGIINSYYDVSTAGIDYVTIGALYSDQFDDWLPAKSLDINSYLTNDGTYYLIGSVQNLKDFLGFVNSSTLKFRVSDNIDLSGISDFYIPYLKVKEFNGGGKIISNLTIDIPRDYIGLFGYLASGTTITHLCLEDVNIAGMNYVGAITGTNIGTISSSYATGSVVGHHPTSSDGHRIGGLAGANGYGGIISNSYASVSVDGYSGIGGLVGSNSNIITDSYASGNVTGHSGYIGGLSGITYSTIINSYATGNVSGGYSGGLIGRDYNDFNSGTVTNSYFVDNTHGAQEFGEPTTLAALKSISHAVYDQGNPSEWDYVNLWEIDEGVSLPTLIPPIFLTWDGGSLVDSNWSTAENWVDDIAPTGLGAEELIFTGSTRLSNINDFTGKTFVSITIQSSGFALGGTENTIIADGIVDSTVSGTNTISFPMQFNSTRTIEVTNSGQTLTISDIISGDGGITKAGAGTLVLNSTNDFAGITTITGGTLSISADGNLGAVPGSVTPAAITFNGAGATLKTTDDFTIDSHRGTTLTTAGTVYVNTGCVLTYGGAITGSGGLTKDGPGSLTISNGINLIIKGTLNLTDGTVDTGTLEARGNVVVGPAFDGGTSPLIFSGASGSGLYNQTFDLTGATDAFNADITVNKSYGQVDLLSGLVMDASGQDLIIQEGTFDLNGNPLTVNGTSGTIVVQDGGKLQLKGDETITANPTYPSFETGSTVIYDGSGTYTSLQLGNNYKHLTFNGTGSWTADSALVVNGNLTLIQGTFVAPATTLNVSGNMNLYANSVFTNNGGTVILDGTTAQSITSNSKTYSTIEVRNVDAVVTFADAFSATNFIIDSDNYDGTVEVDFKQELIYTITGTLTLNGASGEEITLDSQNGSTQFILDVQDSDQSVDYVIVSNSAADSHNIIASCSNNVSGNDSADPAPHWVFLSVGNTYIWAGTTDTTWATANNWRLGGEVNGYPDDNTDIALINSTDHAITTSGSITIGGLTLDAGFTGSLILGNSLIIDDAAGAGGDLTLNAGTLDANNNALTIGGDTLIAGGTLKTGTGAVTFGNNATLDTVTISSGELQIESDNTIADIITSDLLSWTNSGGTITYNGAGVNTTLLGSLSPYYNLKVDATGGSVYTLNGDIQTQNDLTISQGSLISDGYELNIDGSLDLDGTLNAASGTDDATTINIAGNWDSTNGTFTNTGSTVIFDGTVAQAITSHGESFNNLQIGTSDAGGGETFSLSTADNLDINGAFSIGADALDTVTFDITGDTVYFASDVDLTDLDTFTTAASTAIFDGTTILTSSDKSFNIVQLGISDAGGGETFSLSTADNLDINGAFSIGADAADAVTFDISDDTIRVAGGLDLRNLDTFTTVNSTVILDGTLAQNVYSNDLIYNNLEVQNADNDVIFKDLFSTTNFTIDSDNYTGTVSVKFKEGLSYTISGTLTLDGATGEEITLDSENGLTQFTFDVQAADQNVDYVIVSHSAADGHDIVALFSTNVAGNDSGDPTPHWVFSGATSTYIWTGATDATWATANNWLLDGSVNGYPDDNTDIALINSTAYAITTVGAIVIGELKLDAGFTGSVTLGNSLTIDDAGGLTGDLTLNAGTLYANNNTLTIDGDTIIAGGTLKTGTGTVTFGNNPAVDTVAISSGELQIESDNVEADIVISNLLSWTNTGGTITYLDSGSSTELFSSLGPYYNLVINSDGETFTQNKDLAIAHDLTVTAGTLVTDGYEIDCGGSVDIDGTLNIANGTGGNTTVNVEGNWDTTGGVFTSTDSTVVFDGTGISLISGSNIFNDFICIIPGKTFTFEAGSTQTIEGALTLTGTAIDPIILNSSDSPNLWDIDPQGNKDISYVNISDCNNNSWFTPATAPDTPETITQDETDKATEGTDRATPEINTVIDEVSKSQIDTNGADNISGIDSQNVVSPITEADEGTVSDNTPTSEGESVASQEAEVDADKEEAVKEEVSSQEEKSSSYGFDYSVIYEEREKYKKHYVKGKYRTVVIVFTGKVAAAPYSEEGIKEDKAVVLTPGKQTSHTIQSGEIR